MKITIIGNVGSGKTTLARNISKKLNIPHIQLDRIWFEVGGLKSENRQGEGRERVQTATREKVDALTRETDWVSDGWYKRIQPMITERADRLIFLDIPIWRRTVNHLRRMFSSDRHPELSKWNDIKFFYEIFKRRFTHDPVMRAFLSEYKNKTIILRNYKEVENFLKKI